MKRDKAEINYVSFIVLGILLYIIFEESRALPTTFKSIAWLCFIGYGLGGLVENILQRRIK